MNRELSLPASRTDVRESEKIECRRFRPTRFLGLGQGFPPKLHQPSLVRMQPQPALLESLPQHVERVYASLPTVARRKARLATGLLATALAGLDFHQLDSFERFRPLTGIPLPQALLGAINHLSAEQVIASRLRIRSITGAGFLVQFFMNPFQMFIVIKPTRCNFLQSFAILKIN